MYYEKSMDIVYIEAETRDIGRLAYRNIEKKNPGPRKLINKAIYIEPVSQDLLIGFATGLGY